MRGYSILVGKYLENLDAHMSPPNKLARALLYSIAGFIVYSKVTTSLIRLNIREYDVHTYRLFQL